MITICKRNVPIAEIRPIPAPPRPRVFGIDKGQVVLPDAFFEPLPEPLLSLFEGRQELPGLR